jgi:hypothetical protein
MVFNFGLGFYCYSFVNQKLWWLNLLFVKIKINGCLVNKQIYKEHFKIKLIRKLKLYLLMRQSGAMARISSFMSWCPTSTESTDFSLLEHFYKNPVNLLKNEPNSLLQEIVLIAFHSLYWDILGCCLSQFYL